MVPLPLIAHRSPESVFAWRDGAPIAAAHYLAEVQRLAAAMPERGHVLNVCSDRYRFAVGLGAALLRRQVTLMPPNHTAGTVTELLGFAPDAYCLTDHPADDIDLPQLAFPPGEAIGADVLAVPRIDPQQVCAIVFTSGSTGRPEPHLKRWGPLVRNVVGEAARLGLQAHPERVLVATVPPQHMYGFESSLLVAMQSGASFDAGRPFYPADICTTLARIDAPRVLVTTPFHLRTLLGDVEALPTLDLIVCATAPLSPQLAREAEQRSGAPLLEIYGCTETGQLATRRATQTGEWEPLPEVRIDTRDGRTWASGGHVEQAMPLADIIETVADGRFVLHGRSADVVNLAGKRTSLAYLGHQLNSIEGVEDGVFYLPAETADDGVTRLAAFVVAPNLNRGALLAQLRRRVDSVFLPRPLVFVDALPRSSTGKLPHAALAALAATHLAKHAGPQR
ncbi:MAG: acyl-CoA synthetase [Sterolibacteriaceae bacterium]|nr:acyl-CoA synthetase [Candidatus Methylophosphatis haderslevensis]